MRNFKKFTLAALCAMAMVSLAACGETTTTSESSSESLSGSDTTSVVESPYTIKITAIGSTDIAVSKTVQLRTTVTNTTEKDVTWESLNPEIASVTSKGLVTGLKEGSAAIKATLNIDPNCFATINVNVTGAIKPDTLTITGYSLDNIAYVDEDLQLSVNITPSDAVTSVNWATSNASIATITADGLASFLSEGEVKITATSKVDATISDYVDLTVLYGTFYSHFGAGKFDVSHQSDSEPYVELKGDTADQTAGFNAVYFNHVKATKFYAETTFQGSKLTSNTWSWQGIGIGSGLSDSDSRFFTFSPHSPSDSNNYNKVILRDRPEAWGALTDRTQIWGEHGLDSIVYTAKNKLGILRNENEYYYLINDKVYYYDVTTKYDGIATMPFLVGYDMPVVFTNYLVTTDAGTISNKLASAEYNKSFYPAYDNVSYTSDSDFTFNSLTTLSKDHKVKSIGDKAKLIQNFDIEFDVQDMVFNNDKASTGLTINLTRYDSANIVDTITLGHAVNQDKGNAIIGRFTKWNYTTSFENPSGISDWFETTSVVKSNAQSKSSIKITRRIANEISTFHLYVDGIEYTFDLGKAGSVTGATSTYAGSYLIWVAGEYATSHISNFVFRSSVLD
jgi:hypothetical protein